MINSIDNPVIDSKDNNQGTDNKLMVKKVVSISLSDDLLKWFDKHCKDNDKKRSTVLERLLADYKRRGGKI